MRQRVATLIVEKTLQGPTDLTMEHKNADELAAKISDAFYSYSPSTPSVTG